MINSYKQSKTKRVKHTLTEKYITLSNNRYTPIQAQTNTHSTYKHREKEVQRHIYTITNIYKRTETQTHAHRKTNRNIRTNTHIHKQKHIQTYNQMKNQRYAETRSLTHTHPIRKKHKDRNTH